MSTKLQQGYLLLADISGYTSFLAGTELEHAQEIMSDLLEVIVQHICPTMTLSKLEGDAVFAYAADTRLTRGETVLELIEATYAAFKDRVEAVHRRTTCECAACRAIPTLDLKFMAHYGTFVQQSVAGNQELVGSDVNLAHRLMKNHVVEATGWHAYALFTAACLEKMAVAPEEMHEQAETYEHLGSVPTASLNLLPRYQALVASRQAFVSADEADFAATHDFPAPPPVVWEWLNDIQKREQWGGHVKWTALSREGGRTGPGTRNHCAHGRSALIEEVLDWRPFDYFTTRSTPTSGPPMIITVTTQLEPIPAGTRMHYHVRMKPPMPMPRAMLRAVCRMMYTRVFKLQELWATADRLMAEEQATAEPIPA